MKEEKINFYEKIISIILIIAIILPCFPISVLATEVKAVSQSLEVDETSKFKQSLITSTNEITEGNNVTISIQISDTSELEESPNLYTAKISYDTSILKYQSAKGSNGWNLRLFDYVTNVSEVSEPMESMQETTKEASIILEKNDSEMLVDGTIIYITFIVLKSPAEEEADPGTQISLSDGKLIVYDETEDEHLNMQLDDITGKTEYTSENTELKIGSSSEQMWTINYNANEGEEATIPASQTTKTGNNIIVSEEIPTREGAEFSGWAKDADADDIQYNVGGEVKYESVSSEMQDSNSLTLYAIWAKQEYKIVYFYNGGHKDDSENNVETKVKVYGEDYTIEDGPTREGYIFDGWYDIANMKKYEAQAKYQAEMELYLVAQWKPASYTVTLDAQDGTIPEEYAGNGYEEDVQKENGQTKIKVTYNDTYAKGEGTLPIPTKDKYTFLGWYTEQGEGNGVRIDEDSICTKTAEHTLYAHWKANEIIYWDIYYNVDGTVTKETKEDKETINLKEEQQKTG